VSDNVEKRSETDIYIYIYIDDMCIYIYIYISSMLYNMILVALYNEP
jgi:hypothetical protein